MDIRFGHSPREVAAMNTEELRGAFLVESPMQNDRIHWVYSHYDRVLIGGAKPVAQKLKLESDTELKADFFLERRELGVINVGGKGKILADGSTHTLDKLDCLYLGKGVREIVFESADQGQPACFYLLSSPAHATHPVQFLGKDQAQRSDLGSLETSNARTIYKYIHAEGLRSCQLVMGLTILAKGSVWNTMPAHTHTRRMEAYFYFDVPEGQRVFHLMGHPTETRHIVMANHQAVISPPWSIHSGCGTSNYGFIWGMAGENYTYTDMDAVSIPDLR